MRRSLRVEQLEVRLVLSAIGGQPNPNESVDTAVTAAQLAQALVGPGVTVSNAMFTGGATAKGSFTFSDATVIGFNTGIILSSGSAADVVGPNTSDWTSTDFMAAGDADLSALSGYPTFDAAVLEFDFQPTANQVVFSYAFASDEYPEWVNTVFNDVFAFYVNGVNYATVRQVAGDPNSPFVPVAVNNINNGNPAYYPDYIPQRPDLFRANYVDPNGGPSVIDLEQDGITRVLTLQAPVIPNTVNHMKLAIADASDGIYDSAVFIQAGSLVSNENPVADLSVSPQTGAAPLLVTAYVEGEDPNGLPLSYSIDWGDSSPPTTGSLTFPLNEAEKTAQTDHVYTTSGSFTVTLTVSNGSLSDTSIEDVDVTSNVPAAPIVLLQPMDQSAFDGGSFTFTAAASGVPTPSVQWQVSTDFGATFVSIPGANSATYTAQASLANDGYQFRAVFANSQGSATTNAATLYVSVGETAPTITLDPVDQTVSAGDLFSFTAAATGSPAPTVQWQVSIDAGQSWTDIAGANATTYSGMAAVEDDGYQFRAVFSNDQGVDTTQSATLTVVSGEVDLEVTLNPSDQTVVDGKSFVFSAAANGAQAVQWQISTDSGLSWANLDGATETTYSGLAPLSENGHLYRAVFYASADDPAEFVTTSAALLTVRPTAPNIALANDSGRYANDRVTNDATLDVSGLADSAIVEYSVDGGNTWDSAFGAAEGLNSVLIRQTVDGGLPSDATSFDFVLDTTRPKPPRADLVSDTGSSPTDHITQVGTVAVTNIESGADVEYSTDGGASWSGSFNAMEGENELQVRQADVAGNISDAALLSFLLDTTPPAVLAVSLANDTGSSGVDNVTRDGDLAVGGNEAGATIEYSTNGGTTWSSSFTAVEGTNTVAVRQTDISGNVSETATLSFLLDTTRPTLNPTFSTGSNFFLVNQAGVTVLPNVHDDGGIDSQSVGTVDTSTPGHKTLTCTATDIAGNSSSVDLAYVVGYAIVNTAPLDGTAVAQKGTLTVSFQLRDANGLISDQTAAGLLASVVMSLDGTPLGHIRYNKKTDTFSVDLKLHSVVPGAHEVQIDIVVDGASVANEAVLFTVT